MKNNKFILFLHIQKTAGMTLQEKLRNQYGPFFLRRIINRITGRSYDSVPMRDAIVNKSKTDDLFMGHFCYGIHRYIDRDYTYVTFLRNPVSRLISLYRYSHDNPTAYYHQHAKGRSVEEFLLNCKLLELDNGMTRFLAGSDKDDFINRTPYGECSDELLETALANVANDFSFVGIQEAFDKSMLLMAKTFNWSNPYYLSLNIAKTKNNNRSDELVKKLEANNRYDLELYHKLSNQFSERYEKEFGNNEAILDKFQNENRKYQNRHLPLLLLRLKLGKMRKRFRRK